MGGRFQCIISPNPNRECFSSYTNGDYDYVKMGNDGACRIVGIREVCLLTSTGCRMVLRDVCRVPDIRPNLISTRRLDDEDYKGRFQNGIWKLYKGNLIVACTKKQNTLYVLHARLRRDQVNVASDTTFELWHKRLCHMLMTRVAGRRRSTTSVLQPKCSQITRIYYPLKTQ